MLSGLFFYLFSAMIVASAFMVITARNPVHSVLFLILAFFNSAGLFLLLGAEFLAMILVIVYVGAVAVLFLFVVMMLDINIAKVRAGFAKYLPIGALVGLIMAIEMSVVLNSSSFDLQKPMPKPADYDNTQELGELLYTQYVYPFEIAGVILLVAIIAAITLTMRKRTYGKRQNPSKQININRKDRIRMVSIEKE